MQEKSFRVFHLIQKAHSALFRAADRRIKKNAGLSSSQHAVLSILYSEDGVSISSIATTLGMKKNSLSELIDRMAAKQLLRRRSSSDDARVSLIFIKPKGRALVEKSQFFVKHYNQKILEPFSMNEQATIERFLRHLISNSEDIILQESSFDDKTDKEASTS